MFDVEAIEVAGVLAAPDEAEAVAVLALELLEGRRNREVLVGIEFGEVFEEEIGAFGFVVYHAVLAAGDGRTCFFIFPFGPSIRIVIEGFPEQGFLLGQSRTGEGGRDQQKKQFSHSG